MCPTWLATVHGQPSLTSTLAIANEAIEALKLEKKQAHEELKENKKLIDSLRRDLRPKKDNTAALNATIASQRVQIHKFVKSQHSFSLQIKDLLHTVNIKDVSQADMRDRLVKQAAKLPSAARNAHRMEKLYTMKVEDLTKANVQLGRANASLKRVEFKFKRTLTEVLSYQARDDALKGRKRASISVE
ncbi:hypothetical protein WAI453_001150 [Rhynchosporium graminicola]|uniref:Uncharacterized protein n=1 Tax=Rhynchosporium graminicola TaxID=2792576 RepID=A0A1E1K6E5_9HELO|nr:uncharacterized protein RCO7_09482 [Rhynchosporium commune]